MICYFRTYVTHENMMFLVKNDVTYENVICPNLCYIRTKMGNVQTYVTHEYEHQFYSN